MRWRIGLAMWICLSLMPVSALAAIAEHVFQPGDEVGVTIITSPDSLTGYSQSVIVPEEGTVNFPQIGPVVVVGRTAAQILPEVNARYRKLFASVFVGLQLLKPKPMEQRVAEAVYIIGQVRSPGPILPVQPDKKLTLVDMVGRAGGVTDQADLEHVLIFRKLGTVETVNYERAMQDGSAGRIELSAGDTVRVQGNWMAFLNTYSPLMQTVVGVVGVVTLTLGLFSPLFKSVPTSSATP